MVVRLSPFGIGAFNLYFACAECANGRRLGCGYTRQKRNSNAAAAAVIVLTMIVLRAMVNPVDRCEWNCENYIQIGRTPRQQFNHPGRYNKRWLARINGRTARFIDPKIAVAPHFSSLFFCYRVAASSFALVRPFGQSSWPVRSNGFAESKLVQTEAEKWVLARVQVSSARTKAFYKYYTYT